MEPLEGRAGDLSDLALCRLIEGHALADSSRIAVEAPGRVPMTYGRLFAHMKDVGRSLRSFSLGRDDRIAIVLPNGPDLATAFLCVSAVATSAPLNPAYREEEFDFCLTDLNVKALIVQSGTDSPAAAAAWKRGIPVITLCSAPGAQAGVFTLEGKERQSPRELDFAGPRDIALLLHTSGTTSRPKLVPLTQSNICTSARSIHKTFDLASSDRCLNVMPLFHIHGLIGAVLSSLAAGASVICAPDFYAPVFFQWMDDSRPTWYTAVPTIHKAILRHAPHNSEILKRHSLRFIRSCSSSLPPQLMAELETTFRVPVVECYGSTEASHQIAANPLPPRIRKPGSVGIESGVQVAIIDETGNLFPNQAEGEIVIRGQNVTSGYDNDIEANQRSFIRGWFRTGDLGYFDADGYLFISGRIKEIINRGGEKISPREVDEILLSHRSVAQAVTFGVPDSRLGEAVAAAVVLKDNEPVNENEIRKFVAARLADFKVPQRIVFVSAIPEGPSGKPQRLGLAEKLGISATDLDRFDREAAFTPPETYLEELLTGMFREFLGVERVGIHDSFLNLGGDSILATRVVARISDVMNVNMSLQDFFEGPTVSDLARVIEESVLKEVEALQEDK